MPIPVSATDTGCALSSPVATMALTRKNPNEPSARIIAPQNVSTAATLSPIRRFIFAASQLARYRQNHQNQEQQSQSSARVVTPAGAIRPGWQRAQNQQDQNYQQDRSHRVP